MLDGYGPYISAQVDDVFVSEDSPLIDVDGLMSDRRSTDDGADGVRIMFETGAMLDVGTTARDVRWYRLV
jgi:hypothetical protein